jgi:hypothetical protein
MKRNGQIQSLTPFTNREKKKKKAKQSHYRPRQALRVPGG